MQSEIKIKCDSQFIALLLKFYDRPETVEEVEQVLEMHRIEALDAKDPSLMTLTYWEVIKLLDNKTELEILNNARQLAE